MACTSPTSAQPAVPLPSTVGGGDGGAQGAQASVTFAGTAAGSASPPAAAHRPSHAAAPRGRKPWGGAGCLATKLPGLAACPESITQEGAPPAPVLSK